MALFLPDSESASFFIILCLYWFCIHFGLMEIGFVLQKSLCGLSSFCPKSPNLPLSHISVRCLLSPVFCLLSPVFCLVSSLHHFDSIQFSYIFIIRNAGWPSSEFPAKRGARKRADSGSHCQPFAFSCHNAGGLRRHCPVVYLDVINQAGPEAAGLKAFSSPDLETTL